MTHSPKHLLRRSSLIITLGLGTLAAPVTGCRTSNLFSMEARAQEESKAAVRPPATGLARPPTDPDRVPRVSVHEARRRVQAGQALLVCAYPGAERFEQARLEGAISFETLQQRLPSLEVNHEIIFY